jgi:hypothetical protein
MPQLTESLSREEVELKLSVIGITAQDRGALLRSETWNILRSWNEQLAFWIDFSETESAKILDSDTLADIFKIGPSCVRELLQEPAQLHRHPIVLLKLHPNKKKRPVILLKKAILRGVL